jgi:hypothetical protein
MPSISEVWRFLRFHIFSLRIIHCNLLNMIFWLFVIKGAAGGIRHGILGFFLGCSRAVCSAIDDDAGSFFGEVKAMEKPMPRSSR